MIDMQKSTHRHPVMQLIYLLLFIVLGGIVFAVLGLGIYKIFFGSITDLLGSAETDMDINFLRTVQIATSFGLFIAGPLAFALAENQQPKKYFHFHNPLNHVNYLLIIMGIMLLGLPFLEWISSLNQKMVLPDFLKGVELWMREKEIQAAILTKKLLIMNSYGDLAINLIMIAIIPAIGEELLFRGALQNIFVKWWNNPHIAIWISAILFSIIHVQFFGFFPRMLLGALFGYFLLWGKNIWFPIWGHFLNNGAAVLMAFVLQQQGKSIDEIEKTNTFQLWGYLLSAIITLVLLWQFYQYSKKDSGEDLYE